MNKLFKDSLVVGFALFAMFFGAGNIIFPPSIGVTGGEDWLVGFLAYFFADIGLAVIGFIALLNSGNIDRYDSSIFWRLGPWTSRIMAGLVVFAICYLAGPRTAMVSYELGVVPVIGDSSNGLLIYSAIYFFVAWLFCIRQNQILDYVGKFLTPALVIGLLALIIIGMVYPLGDPNVPAKIDNVWYSGLINGYQTMDSLGIVTSAVLISITLTHKGYDTPQSKTKAVIYASLVTGVLMFIVYGGLCYLGATVSSQYGLDFQHGQLLVSIFQRILGYPGAVVLGFVILLACLTTGLALAGILASYLTRVTNGRLKYNVMITLACFSFAMVANIGLENILKLAIPIILVLYPALLVMVVLSFWNHKIKNDNIFRISVGFAVIYAMLEILKGQGLEAVNIIEILPLAEHGFGWLLPAGIGAVVGYFLKPKVEQD